MVESLSCPPSLFHKEAEGGEAEISRRKRTREGGEGGWLWSRKKGKEEEEEESIKHEAWLGEVCCFLIRSPFSLFLLGVRDPWDRHGILSPYIPSPNDSALPHGKKEKRENKKSIWDPGESGTSMLAFSLLVRASLLLLLWPFPRYVTKKEYLPYFLWED